MIRVLWTVLAGELKLQLRQPLALVVMLVVPLFLVPGALGGMELYMASLERAVPGSSGSSGGPRPELAVVADEAFAAWVEEADRLVVVREGRVPEAGDIEDGAPLAAVVVDGHQVLLSYRIDVARSREAVERVRKVARRHERELHDEVLAAAGVPVSIDELVVVKTEDHAPPDRRGGDRLGSVLPPLLLFALVVAAVFTALDVVSGEKERGTIETLLVSAVDRRVVVLAKGLVTAGSAALAGWIGLGSLWLLAGTGLLELPTVLGEDGARALSLGPMLAMSVAVALLALQAAGVSLIVAAWAPDYRTGSMISGPAMIGLIAPAGLASMPGIALTGAFALVPVANVSLACRDLLAGSLDPALGALTLATTAVYAALSGFAAWRLLAREEALVGGGDAGGRRALGFFGRDALGAYVLAVLLMWFFGQLAQTLDLVWGMVFTQVVLLGGVALGAALYLGVPVKETLSLRAPRLLDLALAVPAGLLMPAVGVVVATLQDPLIPSPEVFLEAMRALELEGVPAWVPLVVFAVLPGLFEELLFRGTLLGLLRRSLAPVPRVLVVAAAFGLLHLALPRLLTTGALGIVLGFAVLRSGSLWPAVVMHTLNNATALTLGRTAVEVDPPLWAAVLGALGCCGLVAAMRGYTAGAAPR